MSIVRIFICQILVIQFLFCIDIQANALSPLSREKSSFPSLTEQSVEYYDQSTQRKVSPQPSLTPTKHVTIQQLEEIALQNHPAVRSVQNRLEAERGVRRQVSLRPNPVFRYEAEEIGAEGKAGKQGIVFEQEIVGNNRRKLLVAQKDRTIETLDSEKLITAIKIQNDVRLLAYKLLIAQKKVEFNRQLVSNSRLAVERAQTSILSGGIEITQLNLIQLQNQRRQAELALGQAENNKEEIGKRLAILIGVPYEEIGEIIDAPENLGGLQIEENTSLDEILKRSPEIAKKRAEIELKRMELAYEQTPQRELSISGGASYDFTDNTTLAQVGVGIPIRINNRNQGNIQRALAEYHTAQSDLECLRLKLRMEFSVVFSEYKTARAEVLAYQGEIIPNLEKFFSMSQKAYDQGEINFLEISSARSSYIEASVGYLDSLERLADSIVKLEGSLLENSVADVQ